MLSGTLLPRSERLDERNATRWATYAAVVHPGCQEPREHGAAELRLVVETTRDRILCGALQP